MVMQMSLNSALGVWPELHQIGPIGEIRMKTIDRQAIPDEALPRLDISGVALAPQCSLQAFSGETGTGYYDPPHTHDRAQFSYRVQGVAIVQLEGRSVLLPPGRGVWIPAGVEHAVSCRGPAAYRAFYAAADAAPQPHRVHIIDVSPLLAALIEDMVAAGVDGPADTRSALIVQLILGEIERLPNIDADVPIMPTTPRLRRMCEAFRLDPAATIGIDDWASQLGMSRRTFSRTFRTETGMSFGVWQHQVRLARVLEWDMQGMPAADMAFRLGYGSVASFNRAFGRVGGG